MNTFKDYKNAWFIQAFFFYALFITSVLLLGGCSSVQHRIDEMDKLAHESQFQSSLLRTADFTLYTARSSFSVTPDIIHVVIEGDGFAWLNRYTPSENPTPRNPIGFRIASALEGQAVIYIARPCQYVADENCNLEYWTKNRFAPEVISAFNHALGELKQIHGNDSFMITGYSGGAYIAMRLSTMRSDITDVFTVAGLLDPHAWTAHHAVTSLSNIPDQIKTSPTTRYTHYCGENDDIVPCSLGQRFIQDQMRSGRTKHSLHIVPDESHSSIWRSTSDISAEAHKVFVRP